MARDAFDQSAGSTARPTRTTLRFVIPEPTREQVAEAVVAEARTDDTRSNAALVLGSPQSENGQSAPAGTATHTLDGLVAISFDLPSRARTLYGSRATTSSKEVRFRHKAVGAIDVTVADEATLLVDGPAMARLLAGEGDLAKRLGSPGEGQISLSQLRDMGLTVRYDPVADAIDLDVAS